MRVQAKVTLPKIWDLDVVPERVSGALAQSSRDVEKEMNKPIADWENKPEITTRKIEHGDGISYYIIPTGSNAKFWNIVSGGVEATIIRPVRKKWLKFKYQGPGRSYAPKTRPGWSYGGPGEKRGETSYFKAVHWPGITPREFERQIILRHEPKLRKHTRHALDETVQTVTKGR